MIFNDIPLSLDTYLWTKIVKKVNKLSYQKFKDAGGPQSVDEEMLLKMIERSSNKVRKEYGLPKFEVFIWQVGYFPPKNEAEFEGHIQLHLNDYTHYHGYLYFDGRSL